VLENLSDPSEWIRWNSFYELQGIVESALYPFTQGDLLYVRGIAGKGEDGRFKEGLLEVAETLARTAVEGPPLVKEPPP